jgi:hypothetical protein
MVGWCVEEAADSGAAGGIAWRKEGSGASFFCGPRASSCRKRGVAGLPVSGHYR